MRTRTLFSVAAALTLLFFGSLVAVAADAASDAVAELGRINGLALACDHRDVAARAKQLMITRVAKTRELGALFEERTSTAYTAQAVDRAACPGRAELAVALEAAALKLPQNAGHQTLGFAATPDGAINPRYLLQDSSGRAVMDSDFHGRYQLVTFGYTFCPDVCPTTLVEMASVLKALGNRADRVQALFVSVDPERDTAAVLKQYTAFFDPRILAATGSPELVRRAAENFKVRYEKVPSVAGGAYAMDHTGGMVLLGPDGGFVARFPFGTAVAEIVSRIEAEMAAQPQRPGGARGGR